MCGQEYEHIAPLAVARKSAVNRRTAFFFFYFLTMRRGSQGVGICFGFTLKHCLYALK
jgi:hypothetical protein